MLALYGVLWRHYMRRQGCPLRCSSAATTALTYRTQRPSSGGGLDLFYVVAKVAKRRAAIRVNEFGLVHSRETGQAGGACHCAQVVDGVRLDSLCRFG